MYKLDVNENFRKKFTMPSMSATFSESVVNACNDPPSKQPRTEFPLNVQEIETHLPQRNITKTDSVLPVAAPQKNTVKTSFIEFINEELYDEENTAKENEEFDNESIDSEQEESILGQDSDTYSIHLDETCSEEMQTDASSLKEKIICGLVNIDKEPGGQYTLQCFFCYTEFPIHLWIEYCKHLKSKHANFKKKYIDFEDSEKLTSISEHNEIKSCQNSNLSTSKCVEFSINHEIGKHLVPTLECNKTILKEKDSTFKTPAFQRSECGPENLSTKQPHFVQHLEPNTDEKERHVINLSDDESNDDERCPAAENYSPSVDHSYSYNLLNVLVENRYENDPEEKKHIRLGKTRIDIVMDFLNEITSHPYLWYTQLATFEMYESGLEKVVDAMNKRWKLSLSKDDLPEDIELIKKWYSSKMRKLSLVPDFANDYKLFHKKCSQFVQMVSETNSYKKDCDLCQLRCFGEIGLQVHKFRKHCVGEIPYQCYTCGRRYDYIHSLYKHIKSVHKNPGIRKAPIRRVRQFSCTKCSRKFVGEKAFNAHKDMHHRGERKFSCDVCGRKFLTLAVCKTHRKRHFPAPYECELCGKKYYLAFPFKEHIKVHKSERDFMCEWCGQNFVRNRTFKEHVAYVHQNEGLCIICGKHLKTAHGLYKHRRAFHRPFIGLPEKLHERLIRGSIERSRRKTLPKRIMNKYNSIIDAATKKRRICCPDCDKHYFGYDSLYAHMKKIHGIDPSKRTNSNPIGTRRKAKCKKKPSISEKTVTKSEDETEEVVKVPTGDNNIYDFSNTDVGKDKAALLIDEVVYETNAEYERKETAPHSEPLTEDSEPSRAKCKKKPSISEKTVNNSEDEIEEVGKASTVDNNIYDFSNTNVGKDIAALLIDEVVYETNAEYERKETAPHSEPLTEDSEFDFVLDAAINIAFD